MITEQDVSYKTLARYFKENEKKLVSMRNDLKSNRAIHLIPADRDFLHSLITFAIAAARISAQKDA